MWRANRRTGKVRSRCSRGCCRVGPASSSCWSCSGFAATDFVITKTLSAADAAVHLIHNPMWSDVPGWLQGRMTLTMLLLVLLGTVFLRGFREVIGVAVVVVAVYLAAQRDRDSVRPVVYRDAPRGGYALVVRRGAWRLAHGRKLGRPTAASA